jgi:hypothetical protein
VAATNLALSLALTPELGLEGPAVGTAVPFFAAFPFLLRLGLGASGASLADVLPRAYLPAYALGAALALALVAARLALDPDALAVVGALAVGAMVAYWLAYYALVLSADERAFVRDLVATRAPARRGPR